MIYLNTVGLLPPFAIVSWNFQGRTHGFSVSSSFIKHILFLALLIICSGGMKHAHILLCKYHPEWCRSFINNILRGKQMFFRIFQGIRINISL